MQYIVLYTYFCIILLTCANFMFPLLGSVFHCIAILLKLEADLYRLQLFL